MKHEPKGLSGVCANCRFWAKDSDSHVEKPTGQCKRYPPIVCLTDDGHGMCLYPATESIDWCGEFAVRVDA